MILLNMNFVFSYADEVKGAADIYKVRMIKLELCTGYDGVGKDFDDVASSDDFCNNPVVIGLNLDGVEVDIASVNAGAVAGAFGNAALLPLGETYTHVRVTLDRKMTIRTESAIDTNENSASDNCMTITTTDAMYENDEATDKYTHKPVVVEGGNSGTAEEMTMYLINGRQAGESTNTYIQCLDASCTDYQNTWNWTYPADASNLNSAVAMQTMRSTTATDNIALVYELSNPYTVSLIPPKIDLAFSTSAAVQAEEVSYGGSYFCRFAIEEPSVTITIQ